MFWAHRIMFLLNIWQLFLVWTDDCSVFLRWCNLFISVFSKSNFKTYKSQKFQFVPFKNLNDRLVFFMNWIWSYFPRQVFHHERISDIRMQFVDFLLRFHFFEKFEFLRKNFFSSKTKSDFVGEARLNDRSI